MTLARHHKAFGSARTARGPRALDLVGSAPRGEAGRVPRGRAPRSVDRYTTSPRSVFRGAREGWNDYHDFSTVAVSPGTAHTPRRHRSSLRAARGGLRNVVLASPRHWYPTAMPHALRRATHAPRPRSARAPLDLLQSGGWLPPPHTNLSVPPACDAQAECHRRVRVALLSGQGISNSYQPPGKASSAFWHPQPDLL